MNTRYKIEGMHCEGCEDAITRALQRAGFTVRDVSSSRGEAELAGEIEEPRLKKAVEDAGYTFAGKLGATS